MGEIKYQLMVILIAVSVCLGLLIGLVGTTFAWKHSISEIHACVTAVQHR